MVVVSQAALVGKVLKELGRQGVKDLNSRQLNTVIRAIDSIIAEINTPTVRASADMGLKAWRKSDDTGLSSLYLAAALSGQCTPEFAHPWDSGDFGRCVRLLEAVPELRPRLELLDHAPDPWPKFLACWAELEALYRAGRGAELSRRIAELVR
jgi:hypothetical protein